MSSFFPRLSSLHRPFVLVTLGLLLAACSTPKSTWDMTESQRIRAANNGNMAAIRSLQSVNYYLKDRSQRYRTREEIMKWVRKGAEVGDPSSQYRLAIYMLYGDEKESGVARNPAEAHRLAQSAADNMKNSTDSAHVSVPGWAEGARALAARAETIVKLQPLAEKGDAEALWGLSQAYAPLGLFGIGTTGNSADQEHWLRKAADAGQPDAALAMAAKTTGDESLAWKQKAAAKGTAEGMIQVADDYFYKRIDEQNALAWYRKAAAKGHPRAKVAVIQLTDATAVRLKKAALAGDTEAMFELGEHYRVGNWGGKDAATAQSWHLAAAAKGHVGASYQAALDSGDAGERSRLMRAAAAAGHAGAVNWVKAEENRLAQEKVQRERAAEASRQRAAAEQAQRYAEQQAFVARIDREGTTDSYEAEVYCKFGGSRCDAMRRAARNAMEQRNSAAEAANMRRIQNLYSDGKSESQRNQEYQDRMKCIQNNTQALQNNMYGKTDWSARKCD
jgi:TPR repeat protein